MMMYPICDGRALRITTRSRRSAGERPAAGSSNRMNLGAPVSDKAISSCRCWPWLSVETGVQNIVEMDAARDGLGLGPGRVACSWPQKRQAAAGDAAASDKDAIDDCEPREQLTDLIGAPQTSADPLVDGERRHILAEKVDAPSRRRKVAGDRIEQRRLSGAVRTENRPPLAGLNPKVDVGERDQGAELRPTPSSSSAKVLLDERRSATLRSTTASEFLSCSGQGQLGLSRLATPSFRKSASGMPSV